MRSSNVLRASVFSIGAIFLIFSQDHSVDIGMRVLQFVTAALAFGGLILFRITKAKYAFKNEVTDELFVFRSVVFLFVMAMAIYELVLSRKAHPDDVLELRISAGLGLITGLVFSLAPLDELNAVGFLSAYLALSAVHRAVWAASPTNRRK